MKSGYDQFFKSAKKSSVTEAAPVAYSKRASKKQNSKRSFPITQMVMFFVLIGGVIVSIQYLDGIEEFISSLEITMSSAMANSEPTHDKAGTANSADPKTAELKPPDAKPEASKDKAELPATVATDDPTDYMFKLADRKKQLDKREADLVRREDEINKLKAEIESKLVELKGYRDNISVLLKDKISSDSGKVETLVQVYSTMKPSQAAKVFETMDEDLVIEILSKMKKKSAADILNLVKSDKAQILAEKYAGYRLTERKVSSTPTDPASNLKSSPKANEQTDEQQSTKEESDQ